MNLKALKAEVQLNIDDPNNELVADDNLRLMINRGIRKVWKELIKNGIYLKKRYIPLSFVTGTQEVVIDTLDNVAKIVCVLDEDENRLDIVEQEFALKSTVPVYYVLRGTTIVGVPAGSNKRNDMLGYYMVPNGNFDVNLVVCDKPDEFSSSSASSEVLVDIPEDHHDCITTWATIQILAKDEEDITFWVNQWNEQISDLVASVGMENKNDQSVVDIYGD